MYGAELAGVPSESDIEDRTAAGLNFKRAKIANEVDLTGTTVWRGIDGTGARIDGDLKMIRVHALHGKEGYQRGTVNFGQAHIGGQWNALSVSTEGPFTAKALYLQGGLVLESASVGNPDVEKAQDSKSGEPQSPSAGISSGFRASMLDRGLILEDACILGDLNLKGVKVGGRVHLQKARISGQTWITQSVIGRAVEVSLDHAKFGSLTVRASRKDFVQTNQISMVGFTLGHINVELARDSELHSESSLPEIPLTKWNVKLRRASLILALLIGLALVGAMLGLVGGPNIVRHSVNSVVSWIFWGIFYVFAAWTCVIFFSRAFNLAKVRYSFADSSVRDGECAALFLALMKGFSQGPYRMMRRVLERNGDKDSALQLYYRMREREIACCKDGGGTMWFKWIFFVAAGSGVKIRPLCAFLTLYFTFSWLAVFSNPDSVEHPASFVARASGESSKDWECRLGNGGGEAWQAADANGQAWPLFSEAHRSGGEVWNLQDGFWMAIKVHVPLLHLWAKEKWVPASSGGWYYSPLGMRKMWFGMEYETYAVIAQIISYLTIPMLITAVRNSFYRGPEAEEGLEAEGGE
jgi:hypothetical protein